MNIIATDCVGGLIYKHAKQVYSNPFIYTFVSFMDMLYMGSHFDEINWANISDIDISSLWPNTLYFEINNKIKIHFRHDIFVERNNVNVHREGTSLYGSFNKMLPYMINTYYRRVQRMIHNGEPPIFIMHEFPRKLDINDSCYPVADTWGNKYELFVLTTKKVSYSNNKIKTLTFNQMSVPSYNCPEVIKMSNILIKGDA